MGGAMALKHWLVTLLLALVAAVAAHAQGGGEQDFASRFMSLYGKGRAVECTTVSPLMLERMMQLPDVEGDSHTREVLKQLKSIRLVSSTAEHDVTHLYANARRLAERNALRYKLYAERAGKRLYVRRRGSILLVPCLVHPRYVALGIEWFVLHARVEGAEQQRRLHEQYYAFHQSVKIVCV
mgnify:CR=1 FL=1